MSSHGFAVVKEGRQAWSLSAQDADINHRRNAKLIDRRRSYGLDNSGKNIPAVRHSRHKREKTAHSDVSASSSDESLGQTVSTRSRESIQDFRDWANISYPDELEGSVMASSVNGDSIPAYDSSDDRDSGQGRPIPTARRFDIKIDVGQGNKLTGAGTTVSSGIMVKSTISEDLSRDDKDQGAKLRYLQKRLERPTLRSLQAGGLLNQEEMIEKDASRRIETALTLEDRTTSQYMRSFLA